MAQQPRSPIQTRLPLTPPEATDGLYTLTQPHMQDPVGWLWVSNNGALEDWVVTSNWQNPAPGNPSQEVTFDYVAASGTVTSITQLLAWIKTNYPVECPSITGRYRHSVAYLPASCPP